MLPHRFLLSRNIRGSRTGTVVFDGCNNIAHSFQISLGWPSNILGGQYRIPGIREDVGARRDTGSNVARRYGNYVAVECRIREKSHVLIDSWVRARHATANPDGNGEVLSIPRPQCFQMLVTCLIVWEVFQSVRLTGLGWWRMAWNAAEPRGRRRRLVGMGPRTPAPITEETKFLGC